MRPRHGAEFVWTGDAGEGDKIADGILVSALCATPFFCKAVGTRMIASQKFFCRSPMAPHLPRISGLVGAIWLILSRAVLTSMIVSD
jgi:hypothetical protein